MKKQTKNLLCGGAVAALLGWTVYTILKEQTPGQLAAALLGADWRVLLLGLPRADWRWAVEPAGGWARSLSAGWVTLSGGLFVLPYLYKVEGEPGGVHRGLVWLSALGAVSAALALVTAGLLSPRVAAELDGPFFVAAGLLGDSARLEGLVSALWLLPDLVLAGLLSRSWGEGPRPAGAVLAGLALALAGVPGWIPVEGLALG